MRHLAGDGNKRNGVEACIGDGRKEVGCAGSRGGNADGSVTGDAGHALGDEPGALFMAGKNVRDVAVVKRVVEWQDRTARGVPGSWVIR